MWMSTSIKLPNVLKWLLVRKLSLLENAWKLLSLLQPAWLICGANSGRRTTAVLPVCKNSISLSISFQNALSKKSWPRKPLQKIGSPGSPCGFAISFSTKKTFATPRVVPFFSGNSKGDYKWMYMSWRNGMVWGFVSEVRVSQNLEQQSLI